MLISFVRTVRIEAFTAYLPLKLVSEIICLNSKGQLTRGPMAFPSLPHHQPLRCSVLLNRRAEIAPVLTHRRYIGTGPVLNGPIRIGWPQNNIRWQLSSTPESDLTWLQSKKFTGQMGGPCQLSKLEWQSQGVSPEIALISFEYLWFYPQTFISLNCVLKLNCPFHLNLHFHKKQTKCNKPITQENQVTNNQKMPNQLAYEFVTI